MGGMTISVKGDTKAIRKDLSRLRKKDLPKVSKMALNKSLTVVRSRTVKLASKSALVKQKAIRGRTRIRKATPGRLTAEMKVFTQGMPAHEALTSGQLDRAQRKPGIKVGRRMLKGAFVHRVGGVPRGLRRVSNKRTPLEAPTIEVGPTLKRAASASLRRYGAKTYRKEFSRQAKRFIDRRRR